STAKATGAGSMASVTGVSSDSASNNVATATRAGIASIVDDGVGSVTVANNTATGNNGSAFITDSADSKAIATNTGPTHVITGAAPTTLISGALITNATAATAGATGMGVFGDSGETVGSGAAIYGSTQTLATATNGAGAAVFNLSTGTASNDVATATNGGI